MYITVPPSPTSPITETIYLDSKGSSSSVDEGILADSPTVTATVIHSVIATQLVSVVQAPTTTEEQGLYSFTENNGTTTWLGGKTPPATATFHVSTSLVTLQPVPLSSPVSPGGTGGTPSFSTLSSTKTVIVTPIETVTEISTQTRIGPIYSASGPKAYSGLRTQGWNGTVTPPTNANPRATWGDSTANQPQYQTGIKGKPTAGGSKDYSHGTFAGNSTTRVVPRQLGRIVVVTMEGAGVSWTNNYDGLTPTSSSADDLGVVPVTAVSSSCKFTQRSRSSTDKESSNSFTHRWHISMGLESIPELLYSRHSSFICASKDHIPTDSTIRRNHSLQEHWGSWHQNFIFVFCIILKHIKGFSIRNADDNFALWRQHGRFHCRFR